MCGRYTLESDIEHLVAAFKLVPDQAHGAHVSLPRYNQAPTDLRPHAPPIVRRAPLVRLHEGQPHLEEMVGRRIPRWNHGEFARYNTINAKSETVDDSRMYQGPWRDSQRCLIPATGIVEWQAIPGRSKQAFHIQLTDHRLFAMAGLWEVSNRRNGHKEYSFTILTTEANAAFAPVHGRMPVIIDPTDYDEWLRGSPEQAAGLCRPYTTRAMQATAIGRGINNPSANAPDLLRAIELNAEADHPAKDHSQSQHDLF